MESEEGIGGFGETGIRYKYCTPRALRSAEKMATNGTHATRPLEAVLQTLLPRLSQKASINASTDPEFVANTERWSHFNEPGARAVVNAITEGDVEETIRFCTGHGIPFIARSGGHGWTSALANVKEDGAIINLRGLNGIEIDKEAGTVTIGGGTLTGEVLSAAHEAGVHVVIGTCNTVGAIAPMLGGGLGHTSSLYGLAIDNFLSMRLTTAAGDTLPITPTTHPDLWWGVRGAGHNFGIVTSLTIRCHPQVNEGQHWSTFLVFTPDKLEDLIGAMDAGVVREGMSCTLMFARLPPAFDPVVAAILWFAGPEDVARERFSPLLKIGAVVEHGGMMPYSRINDFADPSCVKGGRKPTYSVGVDRVQPVVMRDIFERWEAFTAGNPGAKGSVVLVESYWWGRAREVEAASTAFPHRGDMQFEVLLSMNYEDAGLDREVEELGRGVRDILHKGEKGGCGAVYVNFASGDEDLEQVYGGKERLQKLRALKKEWDPQGCFNFYNPIH